MSPRGFPRRAQIIWLAPRQGEPPAGANRCIGLVGKQSTISNLNPSRSISFVAELSYSLAVLRRLDSLPSTPEQDVHLDRLLCARQIRSVALRLLRSSCDTAPVR